MTHEIQNLIAEMENAKSKAMDMADKCLDKHNISASTMYVGKAVAFDFAMERLIKILKSNAGS